MTHEDAGHYAAKHPAGTQTDPAIANAIKDNLKGTHLSCAAAHRIAESLDAAPSDVGINVDLLEGRIMKCQLGLFGYGKEKKCVKPAETVQDGLETAIRSELVDNRLSCLKAWQLAQQLGLTRMNISEACETLGIKIKPCQLGAF
jgi:hypothetical protein